MRVVKDSEIEQLTFRFYDTLINPSGWSETLDHFAALCGAKASLMVIGDPHYPIISTRVLGRHISEHIGDIDEYDRRFGEEEAAAFGAAYMHPVRTWVTDEEAFGKPADQIACSIHQRDNWGVFRRVAARLNNTPVWNDGIVLNFGRNRGLITDEESAISYKILPHIAKVVELGRPFRLLQQRFNGVLGVLNKLRIGVVIVTPARAIVAANQRAKECSDLADGLSLTVDQRIKLSRPEDQAALECQITEAANAADPSAYKGVLAIERRGSKSPWILETFCLSELTGEIDGQFRGACVFIIDPDHKDSVSTDGMREAFGLTEAEGAVCKMLTEGFSINDIAESRNTSPETVRSQVKSMFSKTESRSQPDLVRRALQVNLPVETPDN